MNALKRLSAIIVAISIIGSAVVWSLKSTFATKEIVVESQDLMKVYHDMDMDAHKVQEALERKLIAIEIALEVEKLHHEHSKKRTKKEPTAVEDAKEAALAYEFKRLSLEPIAIK